MSAILMRLHSSLAPVLAVALFAGCQKAPPVGIVVPAPEPPEPYDQPTDPTGPDATDPGHPEQQSVHGTPAVAAGAPSACLAGAPANCVAGAGDEDQDGDGFSPDEGDCNDCDPCVNPDAIDDGVDSDCDGVIAPASSPACDDGLTLDDADPLAAARAIELCKVSSGPGDWGVVEASWVRAGGTPIQPGLAGGIFDSFGPNVGPRAGSRMLALSSGYARRLADPGACYGHICSHVDVDPGFSPDGDSSHFPQDVPSCDTGDLMQDDIGLSVRLRPPANATGYRFQFRFYSFEYAEWVCTAYNDQFVAWTNPPAPESWFGNVSFDSLHNPVSVNIAFFDVCAVPDDYAMQCFDGNCPTFPPGGCAKGPAELAGTGFDGGWGEDAGATSWLETTAPVVVGEDGTFELRFAIWDTGDAAWDSTALVDGFEWITGDGTAPEVPVHTGPVTF